MNTGSPTDARELSARIDAVLPQTQCRKCGYEGCMPYAQAIAAGAAAINRCPPGGRAGIRALAALLDRPEMALDPDCGAEQPFAIARIDELRCIGCTLCIQACPVDAVIGGPRRMHVIIAQLCTGCELCIPPCPVDCITLLAPPFARWTKEQAAAARERHHARAGRLAREAADASEDRAKAGATPDNGRRARRATIAAALERARARRALRTEQAR